MSTLRRILPRVALLAAVFALSPPAFSQQTPPAKAAPRVILVPLAFSKFTKSKMYVLRGDKLCFTGDCAPYNGGLNVVVRAGGNSVAAGKYDQKCELQWDSAKERYAGRMLWVYASRTGGVEAPIAQIDVTILDKAPFDFAAAPVPAAKACYAAHIKPTADLVADSYSVYCDDKPTAITLDGGGDGRIDCATLTPGKHILSVKASLHDGAELEVGRFETVVPARIVIELDAPADILDFRTGLSLAKFIITPEAGIVPVGVECQFDGKLLNTKNASVSTLTLDLSKAPSGLHKIAVVVTISDGMRIPSPELTFAIKRDLASDYRLWKERFIAFRERQNADAKTLLILFNTRYEGLKQTKAAIDTLQSLQLRNQDAPADIANLAAPGGLEGEDARQLEVARKELERSFRLMQEVSRALQGKLRDLLSYDGTLANAPASFRWSDFLLIYDTGTVLVPSKLYNANTAANNAMANLALVERRGNIK